MAEFSNIFDWFNTRRQYIPKSRHTHSKSPSPNNTTDFRDNCLPSLPFLLVHYILWD